MQYYLKKKCSSDKIYDNFIIEINIFFFYLHFKLINFKVINNWFSKILRSIVNLRPSVKSSDLKNYKKKEKSEEGKIILDCRQKVRRK